MGGPPEEPIAEGGGDPTVIDRIAAPPPNDDFEDDDPVTPTEIDRDSATKAAATPAERSPSITITTAIEAMRDEEVHRTRVFIRLGWVASIVGFLSLPFIGGNEIVRIAFVIALAVGMVV